MREPTLLLGGGMLAADLVAEARTGVVALDRSAVDITEASRVRDALDRVRPATVINCAAYTRVDDAERERERAWDVNARAPGELAAACAARGAMLVHFSTDYIFDGTSPRPYREDDPPAPLNVYGASKLAGEQAIRAAGVRALIVRTQWLFGSSGRSFPATMWERARAGKRTRVVADQRGRPTFTRDLAGAVWQLIARDITGVVHATNGGEATWYDVAAQIFADRGVPELVEPCTSAEYPTPARRPAYSVLDTSRLEQQVGITLPHWTDAVDAWIAGRRSDGS